MSGDAGDSSYSVSQEAAESGSETAELMDYSQELYPQEATQEATQEAPEEATQEAPEEATQEAPEEATEEAPEEAAEEATEATSDAGEAGSSADAADTRAVAPEVRAEINEKSQYSSEINDYIQSVEELEVYQKAGLKEAIVDGRLCLIRGDIDLDYVNAKDGKTNLERMRDGQAPYDAKTGELIELHHIGQDFDSPLAELTADSEHGGKNQSLLHTKETESWRNEPKKANLYNNTQRPCHWMARGKGA